jgi:type II secretory pathway pseudopilin PulG
MTQSVFHRLDEWPRRCRVNLDRIKIDRSYRRHENVSDIKRQSSHIPGFSLVEVTLALGVAALCLLVLAGLLPIGLKTQQASIQQTTANGIIAAISAVLRADVRLPPGQANKVCPDPPDPNVPCNWGALHGHWRDRAAPDTLYFTDNAYQTGG